MKFHTEYLWFCTKNHRDYIRITDKVEDAVRKTGIREGMVLVSAMHITDDHIPNQDEGLIDHSPLILTSTRLRCVLSNCCAV